MYWGVTGGYLAVAAAIMLCGARTAQWQRVFWDLYPLLEQIGVVVCALQAVACLRTNGRFRAVWVLIGWGVLLHGLGDIAWAYEELAQGRDPTNSLTPNLMYVCCYVLTLAVAGVLFRSMPVLGRTRVALDSVIVALMTGLIGWELVYEGVWRSAGAAAAGRTIELAYPLADLVLLTCALFLLQGALGNWRELKRAAMLAAAMLCFAFSDVGASYRALLGMIAYSPGTQLLTMIGFAFAGWACVEARRDSDERARTATAQPGLQLPSGSVAVPALALVVAPAAIAYEIGVSGSASVATLSMSLCLVGVAALRTVVSALDHRKAAEVELRAFNQKLEQTVAERTRSLSAMLNLTAAVGTTLDVAEVLRSAMREVGTAISCDATAAWRIAPESMLSAGCSTPWTANMGKRSAALLEFVSNRTWAKARVVPAGDGDMADEVLVSPLLHGDELCGCIALSRSGERFESSEVELLKAMCLLIGPALENAVSFENAMRRVNLDPVTDLLNHRTLHQQLDTMFDKARARGHELAALMMDLDNFQLFNATYGHKEGDEVLRRVGAIVRQTCSSNGIVGRYGGDEFVAVLPDAGMAEAVDLARRINAALSESGFRFGEDDRSIPLTLCSGVAVYPADCDTYEELLAAACRNLATARREGKEVACTTEVQRATKDLRKDSDFAVLDMLVAAVDNKDMYTRKHSEDVAQYAVWTAEELRCEAEAIQRIQVAALLHDVGKIGIPREILAKPARLTAEETALINRHAWLGAMILGAFPGLEDVVEVVRRHHERWDGAGYPDGLAGEDILWQARLLSVADTFSAMTTDRPYRRALEVEVALQEIEKSSGTQFDPTVVAAFLRVIRSRLELSPWADDGVVGRRAA
jgi:diguanylate cyclase (GGDEF)-like protein/putative nucleotidyltransferase with HDIG domain